MYSEVAGALEVVEALTSRIVTFSVFFLAFLELTASTDYVVAYDGVAFGGTQVHTYILV